MTERTHIDGRPVSEWVYGILGQALVQATQLRIDYRRLSAGMMAVLAEWEKRDADDPNGLDLDKLLADARKARKARKDGE